MFSLSASPAEGYNNYVIGTNRFPRPALPGLACHPAKCAVLKSYNYCNVKRFAHLASPVVFRRYPASPGGIRRADAVGAPEPLANGDYEAWGGGPGTFTIADDGVTSFE